MFYIAINISSRHALQTDEFFFSNFKFLFKLLAKKLFEQIERR